jgi:hypothetical protein
MDKDVLGRVVRDAWVKWAQTQPEPKPSWLVPWDELSEKDREADRCIGEGLVTHFVSMAHAVTGPEWVANKYTALAAVTTPFTASFVHRPNNLDELRAIIAAQDARICELEATCAFADHHLATQVRDAEEIGRMVSECKVDFGGTSVVELVRHLLQCDMHSRARVAELEAERNRPPKDYPYA